MHTNAHKCVALYLLCFAIGVVDDEWSPWILHRLGTVNQLNMVPGLVLYGLYHL